ncbi:MAG: FliG C-terminal domain-containing protein [Paracoccaceae bacterium]
METNLIPHTQIPEMSSDPSLLTQPPNLFGQDRTFSRREKAAMVIGLMMQQGVDLPLSRLPSELQSELTELIGELRIVDRQTLSEAADEFAAVGLSLSGGLEGALSLLEGKISKETGRKLRLEAGVRRFSAPWDRLRALSVEDLVPIVANEGIEVAAVLLSKLEVAKAAGILGALSGEHARRISHAISMTASVTPEAVDRIGQSLVAQMDDRPERAFDKSPADRVGAILTATSENIREEVLKGLDETDPDFAKLVRKAIFTFKDIPRRIAPQDIAKAFRPVAQKYLVAALSYAKASGVEDSVTFILDNMTNRMADLLIEEMEQIGRVKHKEGEEAIKQVMNVLQSGLSEGVFDFVNEEET